MKNMKRSIRRFNRHTKMLRRLTEDRNQHYDDYTCYCWGECSIVRAEEDHVRGRFSYMGNVLEKQTIGVVFSRFADHPKACRGICCCNPRRHWTGDPSLTVQERRHFQESIDEIVSSYE